MLSWLLIFALLTAKLFPDLPAGRWCQRHFVDATMALIGRIERRHILFLLIGLVAIQAFALAMPMDMAFFAAFDAATYLDVALAVWTLAAMTRGRILWGVLRHRSHHEPALRPLRQARPRSRRRRIPSACPPHSSNDYGEPAPMRIAA